MKKTLFILIIFLSTLTHAGNYGLPSITIPPSEIDYSSYQPLFKPSTTPPDMQPLFSQSCDNIKYSGVIENQAIQILNDTRDFITGITDPIVNVNKFEAGIFVYSFMMCLEDEAVNAFDPTACDRQKKITPDKVCLSAVDAFEAISEKDKNLEIVVGIGKGTEATTSVTYNVKKNDDFVESSLSGLFLGGLTEDMFDSMLVCVNSERTKALRFLNDLFTKNFQIKTSIINSINAKCNVASYESGDPSSWSEIYDLQVQMTPGLGDTVQEIATFFDDPNNPNSQPSINDILTKPGVGINSTGPCADGFGRKNCPTNKEREILKELVEAVDLTALFRTMGYEKRKNGILAYLYNSDNDLKPLYGDFVQEIMDGAEANVYMPKHTKIYLDLKNKFGIHSGTELDIALNEIMNKIFPLKAIFNYYGDLNSGTPMPIPLDNPFIQDILHFSTTAPTDESIVVLRTLTNKYITVNPQMYSRLTTETIVGFYRKYVEKLIFENLSSTIDATTETPELNVYLSNRLTTEAIHDLVQDNTTDFIAHANSSTENYGDIIGNNNPITGLAPFYRAAIEEYIFKSYAMKTAIEEFFNQSQLQITSTMMVSQPKRNISYSTMSIVKDFTIPRNLDGRIIFKQIRKFYQLFLIKLNEINLDATIIALSDKVEDYANMSEQTQILTRIEAKVNSILELNNVLNAKTFNFRE